jgi:hypothetical protein
MKPEQFIALVTGANWSSMAARLPHDIHVQR